MQRFKFDCQAKRPGLCRGTARWNDQNSNNTVRMRRLVRVISVIYQRACINSIIKCCIALLNFACCKAGFNPMHSGKCYVLTRRQNYIFLKKCRGHLSCCKLTLCLLGYFAGFSCRLLNFSKSTFSKKTFSNIIIVSNCLDSDQTRRHVGPELGRNCLKRISADDTCRSSETITMSQLKTVVSRSFMEQPGPDHKH